MVTVTPRFTHRVSFLSVSSSFAAVPVLLFLCITSLVNFSFAIVASIVLVPVLFLTSLPSSHPVTVFLKLIFLCVVHPLVLLRASSLPVVQQYVANEFGFSISFGVTLSTLLREYETNTTLFYPLAVTLTVYWNAMIAALVKATRAREA